MAGTLSALNTPAFPPLTSLWVLVLATYVALELGQRVRRVGVHERTPWLLAAAMALSVGLWAAPVLAAADLLMPFHIGFDAVLAVAAWMISMVLCLSGLHALHARAGPRHAGDRGTGTTAKADALPDRSRMQAWFGAAVLGCAAMTTQVLILWSLGLAGALRWSPALLALGAAAATVGFGLALALLQSGAGAMTVARRQALAAAMVGLGVLLAQTLAIEAAGLSGMAVSAREAHVGAGSMVALASFGVTELLLLMLLACVVESRLRGSLDKARTALQEQSLRDEITGLPNRISFEGLLAQAQTHADATQGQAVLLVVALDGFKHVNESVGHAFGDRVLRRMAQRLRGLVKPHSAARLGSDEFLLLLQGDQAAAQGSALATQVLDAIAKPCLEDGREIGLTCSIGMALYPQHGAMSALITNASVAMRASKSAGGATYSLFDPRMVVDTREQADLLRDLRLALSRSQFELYYQPKIHAPSAQITGVEALLRWHHPQRGMISPTIFIPMAERSGLIDTLGAWVIDEACRQARAWRDQGLRMRVAVNLSAHQLRRPDLSQRIAAALAKHQINPDLLTCEITESVAMEDTEATMRFFQELAAVGVHISIDDFGSGYSSLAYLRKLPAGELKIDRSFVLDLETSEEARKIASAVVQLAQALNLKVVAEGVETNEQFQILRQLGCDELQGFLFAKPMSAKALGLWAMADEGPRTMQFSESLFQETRDMAL